jgi:lactoylglutathione lyase
MRLNGLLLYVRDLDQSLHFYRDVLGLPVVARPDPHVAIVGVGNSVLYLHVDPQDMPEWMTQSLNGRYRGIGTILHLQVDDVHQMHKVLLNKGIEISLGPVDQPYGQRHLYLYDPDGYNIVLMQPI